MSNKLNESSKTFTWFAMVALVVLCILNIPIVTWVSPNELLMKLTTMEKMLNLIHDIRRSKENVHVTPNVKEKKTHSFKFLSQHYVYQFIHQLQLRRKLNTTTLI